MVVLLLTGGLLYILGALCYATRWPDPWPRTTLGYHEFLHSAVTTAGQISRTFPRLPGNGGQGSGRDLVVAATLPPVRRRRALPADRERLLDDLAATLIELRGRVPTLSGRPIGAWLHASSWAVMLSVVLGYARQGDHE